MARYTREIRWRLNSEAAKRYLDRGKKLVGEIVERLTRGKLQHGARTIRLEDGTVLKAWVDGGVPIVEIIATDGHGQPGATDTCDLFMESGQLDLGPDVASLSDEGVEPTITHNGRTAYNARFNGGIRIMRVGNDSWKVLRGEPLPNDGTSHACDEVLDNEENVIASRAAKKTAQFLIQPSCFSGLMHRWVQAQYGTASAVYGTVTSTPYPGGPVDWSDPADTFALQVMTAQEDEDGNPEYGNTVLNFRRYQCDGIVDPTRQLKFWFARVFPYSVHGQKIEFRRANLSPCGELLRLYLLAVGRGHPDYSKLMSFLMSQLLPEQDVAVERELEAEYVPAIGPYGWKFNASGHRAACVSVVPEEPHTIVVAGSPNDDMVREGDWVVHQFQFSLDDDGLPVVSVESSTPVTGWVDQFDQAPQVWSPRNAFAREGLSVGEEMAPALQVEHFNTWGLVTPVYDYDAPIYCWYEADTLVVVRYEFATTTAAADLFDGQCDNALLPADVFRTAGDVAACPCPTETCLDPDTSCDYANSSWKRTNRSGFYVSYFSDVALHTSYPDYSDNYESNGQTALGTSWRSFTASEHILGADVETSNSYGGTGYCSGDYSVPMTFDCDGAGLDLGDIGCTPSSNGTTCLHYSPTCESTTYENPCEAGGTLDVTALQRTSTQRFSTVTEGDGARQSILVIPQFDANSGWFKSVAVSRGSGSASTNVGAVFSLPYSVSFTYSGMHSWAFAGESCECGQLIETFNLDCSYESLRHLCPQDDDCYDQPFASRCKWEGGTSTSATYDYQTTHLTTSLAIGGAAEAVDSIDAATFTSSGSTSHPACEAIWAPASGTTTTPAYILYDDAHAWTRYGIPSSGDMHVAMARVWHGVGGDYARETSMRQRDALNGITQVSGYSAKTGELFSFIGWA